MAKMISLSVQAFVDIETEEDDYSWIFDDYDLSDEQKKEFLENHDQWIDSEEDYVSIVLANEGEFSSTHYEEIKAMGIEMLQGRLRNFIESRL